MEMVACYIIMGVSGSGKTTVGKLLSDKINVPFFDADDFHSAANKAKMHQGIPLNDDDRLDWLGRLNNLLKTNTPLSGVILACSALKEKYRSILESDVDTPIYWIVLEGSYELILNRMQARKDHYMPAGLLKSQFEAMEFPAYGLH
ncbi:MAG: gluconokinase, partial [Saprospiraceae bacterium]